MGALSPFGIGRRPVHDRVLVLYRVGERELASQLPPGVRPRTRAGYGILALCYTRLGASRWIPHRLAIPSDHVDYRVIVDFEGRRGVTAGAWVLRRETSSRFEARWGSRLQRGPYSRATFDVEAHELGIELRATGSDGAELCLRAEADPSWSGSIFGSLPDLEVFLAAAPEVRPTDLFAPEADDLELGTGACTLQAMRVLDVRSPFLERAGETLGSVALDCVVRLSNRRPIPATREAVVRRARTEPARALPAHASRWPGTAQATHDPS